MIPESLPLQAHLSLDTIPPFRLTSHWTRLSLDPPARDRLNTPPSGSLVWFLQYGQVAQLVEQRTENPRVGGSIPPLATNPIGDLSVIRREILTPFAGVIGASCGSRSSQ